MKKQTPQKATRKKASSKPVNLRLQEHILAQLDETAERKGTTRSSLIQIAIAEYLERQPKE